MAEITEDQIVWGAALMLLRRYGDDAARKLTVRLEELDAEGDFLGAALWRDIGRAMAQLQQSETRH